MSTKRTYQPSSSRRIKKLGFRAKMKTRSGKKVIARRRQKGRARLAL